MHGRPRGVAYHVGVGQLQFTHANGSFMRPPISLERPEWNGVGEVRYRGKKGDDGGARPAAPLQRVRRAVASARIGPQTFSYIARCSGAIPARCSLARSGETASRVPSWC